ncbi:hypothetical protein LMH87_009366 [Akanthomyces muscarius]|uniref:Uncharacterized protein n=1 Tax=Akanthomyces muscarius TaxID=2231603 RepID=A0A9W8UM65_AKAMU|nr:hypothetical protein LMH87_009366 [Akanthomyces muscarius]KAJ4152846.1 hypothetical protein LMH87_009366 [Akanthomyces muscarius]
MKFIVFAVATLASFATAAPEASGETTKCKPATYRCQSSHKGWEVCNTSGQWVFAGACPARTLCKFNEANGSPYCLPRGFKAVKDGEDEM